MYFVLYSKEKKDTKIILKLDYVSWKEAIKFWNINKFPYLKWTDELIDNDKFVRTIVNNKYFINNINGELSYYEIHYMTPNFKMATTNKVKNTRIEALELETYTNRNVDPARQFVNDERTRHFIYASGWALNGDTKPTLYYIKPNKNPADDPK